MDTMTNDTIIETTEITSADTAPVPEAVAEAVAPKVTAPRRRGSYDTAAMSVTVTEPEVADVVYGYADLPESVKNHLALHGLWMYLRAAESPAGAFAELLKGVVVAAKVAGEKVAELSPWKLAVAHAFVEITKKLPTPMTLETATEKAGLLDRAQLAKLRMDPVVIKQHTKLFPAAPGEPSALAGLLG